MPDSPALCGNLASCAAITSLGPRGQKPAFTTFEQAPAATGVPTVGAGWLTGQQRVGKLETAHGRDSSRAVRRREGGTSRRHLALNDSASRRAQPSDTYKSDYLPCITLARDGRMGSTREPLSRSTNHQMAHVAPRKWLSSWPLLTLVSELHAMLCPEVYPGQVWGRLRCLRDASDEDLPPFRDKITPGGGAKVSSSKAFFRRDLLIIRGGLFCDFSCICSQNLPESTARRFQEKEYRLPGRNMSTTVGQ